MTGIGADRRLPIRRFALILEGSLLPVESSAASNGPNTHRRDDQIAVAAHMRTYDEATQPGQSRHACRTQGVRIQPFLPIPMGDRHSGEARLRFRLYRWRAWAVRLGPARGPLQ